MAVAIIRRTINWSTISIIITIATIGSVSFNPSVRMVGCLTITDQFLVLFSPDEETLDIHCSLLCQTVGTALMCFLSEQAKFKSSLFHCLLQNAVALYTRFIQSNKSVKQAHREMRQRTWTVLRRHPRLVHKLWHRHIGHTVFTVNRKQQETVTTVKRNLNDKWQVSNGEIYSTAKAWI